MRKMFSIIFFWMAFCSSNAAPVNREACLKFFFQPVSEQKVQFKSRPIDEQYDLFICGNQLIHPPAKYLARPFAERGPEIVSYLHKKLLKVDNELTLRDIALILSEANELEEYELDQETILLLDKKSNEMTGPWKEVVRRMVDRIAKPK